MIELCGDFTVCIFLSVIAYYFGSLSRSLNKRILFLCIVMCVYSSSAGKNESCLCAKMALCSAATSNQIGSYYRVRDFRKRLIEMEMFPWLPIRYCRNRMWVLFTIHACDIFFVIILFWSGFSIFFLEEVFMSRVCNLRS
jgi:hypothetical protein